MAMAFHKFLLLIVRVLNQKMPVQTINCLQFQKESSASWEECFQSHRTFLKSLNKDGNLQGMYVLYACTKRSLRSSSKHVNLKISWGHVPDLPHTIYIMAPFALGPSNPLSGLGRAKKGGREEGGGEEGNHYLGPIFCMTIQLFFIPHSRRVNAARLVCPHHNFWA